MTGKSSYHPRERFYFRHNQWLLTTRGLSLADRGLLIDLICLMQSHDTDVLSKREISHVLNVHGNSLHSGLIRLEKLGKCSLTGDQISCKCVLTDLETDSRSKHFKGLKDPVDRARDLPLSTRHIKQLQDARESRPAGLASPSANDALARPAVEKTGRGQAPPATPHAKPHPTNTIADTSLPQRLNPPPTPQEIIHVQNLVSDWKSSIFQGPEDPAERRKLIDSWLAQLAEPPPQPP